MENLAHSRQPNKSSTAAATTLSKKACNGGGNFVTRTTYDDVFGGPPKFGVPSLAPRVDDYAEIFGGFHASRAGSIPVLDLPVVEEEDVFFDVSSSGFDYDEVFGGCGGFDGRDFGVSFEELMMEVEQEQSNGVGDIDSSEEAWTPAETESLGEESDHSGKNQCLSNGDSYESIDGSMEFNISYHKANQRSDEDMSNGVTHVTQLHDVSGYAFLVNKTSSIGKTYDENPALQMIDDSDIQMDFSGRQKNLRKTMSHPANSNTCEQTFENGCKSQRGYRRNSSLPNETFVTISEINLRTQPSEVPPPCRPAPLFDVKKGDFSEVAKSFKNVASEGTTGDNSPPFFDVEVDASSSAAVSAAAMKEAMEKAQASLKNAKELLERKRERRHSRKERKDKEGKVFSNVDGPNIKEERVHATCQRQENGMTFSVGEERPKFLKTTRGVPDSFEGVKLFNVDKTSEIHAQSDKLDGASEWKEETQFFELVRTDRSKTFGQENGDEILVPNTKIHDLGLKDKMGAVEAVNHLLVNDKKTKTNSEESKGGENGRKLKVTRVSGEQLEKNGRSEASKAAHRHKGHEKKTKVVQEVCEPQENEKKLRMVQNAVENEKRSTADLSENLIEVKRKDNRLEHEKAIKHTENEQLLEEANRRMANERRSKGKEDDEKKQRAAFKREESDKRLKEALEQVEKEKRLKEAREREESEKRVREALEQMENEKRLKEESDKKRRETLEHMENEKRLKEELEKKQRETLEQMENETRLKEELEKKQRETLEQMENEKRLKEELEKKQREAFEQEQNERRLKEEYEKKQREDFEQEQNERRLKESREQEENEKNRREACEREENEKRLKEAKELEAMRKRLAAVCEEGDNLTTLRQVQETAECEMRPKVAFEKEETENISKEARAEIDDRLRDNGETEDLKGLSTAHDQTHWDENGKKLNMAEGSHVHIVKEDLRALEKACVLDDFENPQLASQHEENSNKVDKNGALTHEGNENTEPSGMGSEAVRTENVQVDGEFEVPGLAQGNLEHEDTLKMEDVAESTLEKTESAFQMDSETKKQGKKIADKWGQKENYIREAQAGSTKKENKDKVMPTQPVESVQNGRKMEAAQPSVSEGKGNIHRTTQWVNATRKEMKMNKTHTMEEKEDERMKRERELEKERLRKIEEEREREREREKDRMAVDLATLEAREKAERNAVERATSAARQRALADARERLEKACAEAKEKTFADRSSMEARLRAERAAVERATAEARERAVEKAMAERAAFESRERIERTFSEKFSVSSRNGAMRTSSSSSDLQDQKLQSASSFGSSKYQYSVYGASYNADRSEGGEGESAQRCKARLERHQRTAERAAKALAEKNMRDLLAQREQAERNRLAETLDADVKRWSSGKEGNLRALLSTLQYILGPDSGWHPIPLTEVITSAAVKKAYRKATLCVHPDKLQQRGASIQQKYICEKVFDLLKEAWNKFNSEER